MKNRDLVNLLNRAAAGFEHLVSLTEKERDELVEDLVQAAVEIEKPLDVETGEFDPIDVQEGGDGKVY